ncbi:hypothetical protein J41TS12_38310 [Paenibacillus antibioticophila]|uniref:Uncharacterized protein n=1 Tax=Paenibacillus antibioticophila TaxID=1274374 RepID=A0A919XY29_9BACL|nr:hypothetical protein J41TS12_38310 [Paenibacillus antibioticophila]
MMYKLAEGRDCVPAPYTNNKRFGLTRPSHILKIARARDFAYGLTKDELERAVYEASLTATIPSQAHWKEDADCPR